ncbi:MAG TPA: M48 family metallopeptidase [Methanothrix sp.]|nr:M48 family metallopeptidase [Methanothrix sp.]HPJ84599.1 M48 family metallopeptidase [Methanothrix sp.]HPR67152.1 M48 family metallopeptidase [Methanothrix sp.]
MEVIVKRSVRRKKTVQARMVNGALVIMAPASISERELAEHVSSLKARMEQRMGGRDDAHLARRAEHLNRKYFDGLLCCRSISYSDRQMRRFGSCTIDDGTIRISSRMRDAPQWVEDYVVVHELAHLLEPSHNRRFKELVGRYPLTERAKGYLFALDMMERRKGRAEGVTPDRS